jgi:hypothetical protein
MRSRSERSPKASVAERMAGSEGGLGGGYGAGRGTGAGLADLHAQDVRGAGWQRTLTRVGRRDDVHHQERRCGRAFAYLQHHAVSPAR